MKDLKDKVVVITGAGSGIGRALALQMANHGAKLALNDFDEKGLQETLSLLSGKAVHSSVFDMAQKEEVFAFADRVIQEYGRVDVVINNAGVALGKKDILTTKDEDFEWLMGINFWGSVYGTKAFLPYLLKEKEASIVNISSVFGLAGIAEQGPYCSSKFAIRGFTESLRMEMSFKPVTVSSVHPGGIKTNIARRSKGWDGVVNKDELIKTMEDVSFINTPDYAAETIIKGIQKKKEKILIGKDARLLDIITRVFPVRYTKIFLKEMRKYNE